MFSNLLRKYYVLDPVVLNPGVGGDSIGTDNIAGVNYEVVKTAFGDAGSLTLDSPTNPHPVTDAAAEAALASIAAEDFATEATLALIKLKTDNLDISISALRDALRGASSKTLTDLDTDLATLHTDLGALLSQADFDTKTGSLTETAPATDTASSGVNGRLQRIAQRLTSLIALLPTSLGAGGGLKIDGSGTAVPVTITSGGGGAVTIADGADVAEGAIADAIVAAGAAGTISAKLRRVTQGLEDLKTLLTTIDGGIPAALGQTTMANSMPVTIASDQSSLVVSVGAVDNTTLYSNNLAVTGAITGFLTTGYASVVIQLSGTWQGNLVVEGCNDNVLYLPLLVLNANELSMVDVIYGNGNFQFKTTTKYVRINVLAVAGTITALIVGRTVLGISGADLLSQAMDRGNNAPLYVEETATKKDLSKALIPSDAPAPIYGWAQATNAIIFYVDTTGYQSVSIQGLTIGSNITIQHSNDGVIWASLFGYSSIGATGSPTVTSASMYSYPATGRFVRGLMTGASFTNCLVYLRQQPVSTSLASAGAPINIQSIGGTATLSPGVSGGLVVGGSVAAGVAPTTRTLPTGGIDSTGLLRTFLTDTSGRLIGAATDLQGTTRPIGVLAPASNTYGVASQVVTEASQYEGMSLIDIMANILIELRINNAMMNELPQILNSDNGRFDDLAIYKNDFGNVNQ